MLILLLLAAPAAATFSYGTVTSQDPLPECTVVVRCSGNVCADTCADGSVVVDAWLAKTIRSQYDLVADRSWKWGPILGTHNAFISRAQGMGLSEDLAAALYARTAATLAETHVRIPNQRLGPTDLLNLGVRELEFDIYDLPVGVNSSFEVVMCHSPLPPDGIGSFAAAAAAVGVDLGAYNGFLELCSNLTLRWAMQKARDWTDAPGNSDQVRGAERETPHPALPPRATFVCQRLYA